MLNAKQFFYVSFLLAVIHVCMCASFRVLAFVLCNLTQRFNILENKQESEFEHSL